MYAVIQTGGKQYRVQPGDIVQIEKLEGEVGTNLKFDQVLFVSKTAGETNQIWMGKPLLSGASVQVEIVGQGRGDKIVMVKMKRRKQYRRTIGHRQEYTQVLVTGLANGAGETANLSDSDKKTTLDKFQTHLKPRGEAFSTPKWVTGRPRRPEREAAPAKSASASPAEAAPKKTAAKKTAAKTGAAKGKAKTSKK